jgi:hypothetical protein
MSDANPAPTPGPSTPLLSSQSPSTDKEKDEVAQVPYKSAIGSLLYTAQGTRPDLAYAVNACSQHSKNPGGVHWRAVKRILRYLKQLPNLGISYKRQHTKELAIEVYSDSDWASNPEDRRSRTGYVVLLANGPVAWQSKSQKTVALSSCEAELYALCEAAKEIMWLSQLLQELKVNFTVPTLHVDNQAAIALSTNPVNHQRTKHIDIRWFFVREAIEAGKLKVVYVNTADNRADFLTKSTVLAIHRKMTYLLLLQVPTAEQ